jgi:hypothetical protein
VALCPAHSSVSLRPTALCVPAPPLEWAAAAMWAQPPCGPACSDDCRGADSPSSPSLPGGYKRAILLHTRSPASWPVFAFPSLRLHLSVRDLTPLLIPCRLPPSRLPEHCPQSISTIASAAAKPPFGAGTRSSAVARYRRHVGPASERARAQ